MALVELRLHSTDTKIPFLQPWLDKVETKLIRLIPFMGEDQLIMTTNKSLMSNDDRLDMDTTSLTSPWLQPHLYNLCASRTLRSLGIECASLVRLLGCVSAR